MEGALSFLPPVKVESLVLWGGVLLCSAIYLIVTKKRTNIPGPVGLPILGYLPFLGKDAHLTLLKLSKKYGSIFGLYLGRNYVVVVADYAMAKELYNMSTMQDRPEDAFDLIPDGFGFGDSNGQVWTEQRRYTVRAMKDLGFSGSDWEKQVQYEVTDFMNILEQVKGQPMDINKPLAASISNNVLSLVTGHRLPMGDSGRDILDKGIESFEMMYGPSASINYFPTLTKIAIRLGFLKVAHMMRPVERMNKFFKQIIGESEREGSHNYITSYLKEIESRKNLGTTSTFSVKNLYGNVQSIVIAGSDTTKVSLEWLFLAMAAHPDIQDKVQKELDAGLPKGQIACWDDRRRLPYCMAIVYEGQRWRTTAPLNVLRSTSDDTVIQDYVIPKRSQVIAMIYAFHNDTRYWKEPEKFMPERFLTDDGKAIKKREAFEPFSMGKRRCPGEAVALIEIFIYFTAVLHKFRILPEKEGSTPDLSGILGLVYRPKPHLLRFVPRDE